MKPAKLLILALLLSTAAFGDDVPVPDDQVLAWMKELQPLPKVHYSWALPFKKLSNEMLFEYIRLTNAASISGEWSNPATVARAVAVCQKVNDGSPQIPVTLGINYSVWHRRFGKNLPPTDTGETHKAELDYLRSRMKAVRNALAVANKKHNATIKVGAVLFDSERFHVRKDDAVWNAATTAKYDAAYDTVKKMFPNARIEWYARGAVQPGASETGWNRSNYFTLKEKGTAFGCSLYQTPEIGYTREIFRRTAQNATDHKCNEVTPWIALACGYRRQTDKYHRWSFDWNYDLIYSWQLGRELNMPWFGVAKRAERFAPWKKAKVAIFYPEPFGRTPHWGQHFVAYVRGANGVKDLPVAVEQ